MYFFRALFRVLCEPLDGGYFCAIKRGYYGIETEGGGPPAEHYSERGQWAQGDK